MKSKNMVLMVVAVGCGLVAAFLTSQLGAKSGGGPEMVDVLVAKKELTVGTILEEKSLGDMVTKAQYPRNNVPPEAITDIEQVKGRRLNRTLRAGNHISPSDVGTAPAVLLPEGTSQYAIKLDAVKAAAGFVQPGSKVDVITTERGGNGKSKASILLRDMLVVAVDIQDRPAENGQVAKATLNSVSLAVTPRQATMLALAETRGELRLLLRDGKSSDTSKVDPLDSLPGDERNPQPEPGKGVPMVKVAVAKADVPASTKITSENVSNLFELRDVPAPGPGKAVHDLSDLKGKYLLRTLDAEQLALLTLLTEEEPKAGTAPEAPRVPIFEQVIQNGSHAHRAVFTPTKEGAFRRLDLPRAGQPSAPTPAPAPKPADPADQNQPAAGE